jgi:hypothetical protein
LQHEKGEADKRSDKKTAAAREGRGGQKLIGQQLSDKTSALDSRYNIESVNGKTVAAREGRGGQQEIDKKTVAAREGRGGQKLIGHKLFDKTSALDSRYHIVSVNGGGHGEGIEECRTVLGYEPYGVKTLDCGNRTEVMRGEVGDLHAKAAVPDEAGDHGPDKVEDDGSEEEIEAPKIKAGPKAPAKQEREEHEALHMPNRSWCRHCVRGRARDSPHKKADEGEDKQEGKVPIISMDYFFMGQNDEKASDSPIIVMLDEENGNRYARAVGQKGLGENRERE